MIRYFVEHLDLFGKAFMEHLYLVFITLFFSLILASFLSCLILRRKWVSNLVVQIFSAVYSIPSLALFAILIPLFGLGNRTAVLVLVVYNQYLLIRNILAGIWNIDATVLEAGYGMGMSRWQLARMIQIPLAMPSILTGDIHYGNCHNCRHYQCRRPWYRIIFGTAYHECVQNCMGNHIKYGDSTECRCGSEKAGKAVERKGGSRR